MNVTKPPFDNPKVRQAVAYADPLSEDHGRRAVRPWQSRCSARPPMRRRRSLGRSRTSTTPTSPRPRRCWRRPATRTASRRRCRSISDSPASTSRSACWCRRALARSASRRTINKIPGANWRTELNKKVLPLYTNVFSGWLDYPEYFFIWCYHGKNSIFNTMSYQSKEMDALHRWRRDAAATAGDKAAYEKNVKGLRRSCLRGHPAHSAVPALRQRRDAEERLGLSILVPPPARLPRTREGLSPWTDKRRQVPCCRMIGKRADARYPEPDRGRHRHLPADARAARRSGGLFRRARRAPRRRSSRSASQARPRQAAARCSSSAMSRDLARGDLGKSLTTGQPVLSEIRNRLPASAELTLLGLIVSIADRASARHAGGDRGRVPGSIISAGWSTTAGVSLPVFFTGLLLVYVFYYQLGLVARAAGAARRVLQRAAGDDRLLPDR